ncbi:neutral ceramidase [Danio aesculapii]|uniref:neutral ceramidase n=1 Tax=Danio aesculapii TaxID=1142201 RepID=UPI0024BF498A|nr:neutral ceramidase [Danio aesculapii]
MASKSRRLSGLEISLTVLFLLMTAVSVALITVLALKLESDKKEEVTPEEPSPSVTPPENPYLIGVGRADCTGPVADLPMMGYANTDQTARGLHTRLFSRAFIVDDGNKRVVFVTSDIGMVSQRLRLEVFQALKEKYGDLYRQDNVVLSGTHTHSGVGGYFQYTLFMITSKGYIKPSIQAIVSGIVKSIDIAHRNLRPGRIFINKGQVADSNFNRSPHSYMNNPEEERNRYEFNTDKQIVVLKFTDLDGDGIGLLSWFAVHPVSMNYTNRMVSSDNLGYASYIFEQEKNIGFLPGEKGPFVAGFSSSNLGDSSPNIRGPVCVNTGLKCDYINSSCPVGGKKACIAFGPGEDMFESTRIIGENMYKKAKELYGSAKQELHGPVYGAHQWVNMTDETVQFNSTHTGRTCKPALGHSFAAGTTDGGGEFNFLQGDTEGDPLWDGIRDAVLGPPSNETKACHQPKPILFSTGEMDSPLPWHPAIVDVQIITIGSLAVVAVPGEFTTMSGRRIREAVKRELEVKEPFTNAEVVVAGLCNIYTHYITTYEEYQIQRYEGASTIFGPHTLSAYIQRYRGLAKAIAHGTIGELPKGPEPPFFDEDKLFNQVKDPVADVAPVGTTFGDVLQEVNPVYKVGEIASVTFVSGNPRHSGDIRDTTLVTVERFHNDTGSWEIIHNDASWETRFHWIKGLAGRSQAKVEWHIPQTAQAGTYQIQYFGHYKQTTENTTVITPYVGTSAAFKVTRSFYYF